MIATTLALCLVQKLDPNRLPIGPRGEATIPVGRLYDLGRERPATLGDLTRAARGKAFVYLGENHATTAHQFLESEVLAALEGSGRHVAVGLEMYQRPKQAWLDQWSANAISESDFLAKSDWKGQWGFDFSFYRPVFQVVRNNGMPLVGLNVPRDWVRAVAKGGFAALPADAKTELPKDMDLSNREHRKIWDALMGDHPMTGVNMTNMYAAQVLWDEAMADTALKFLARQPRDAARVFVVIAGSGHVMYKQGINGRVARRKGGDGVTLVMMQSDSPVTVAKGLADFVYVSPESTTP